MTKSTIIDAWHAELKKAGIPATSASAAATALCRVLEQQFYMRDRADGAIQQQVDWLKKMLKAPEGDEA